jgi:hypothetical protein
MSNNAPKGFMVILGDALIGETLTARPNAVTDDDGINQNTASFQWLRDGEPIPGATGQTYNVTSRDTGSEISVQYIYRDQGGTTETVTSRPEPAVPSFVAVDDTPYIAPNRDTGDKPESPNNTEPTGWLVILGDAEVGETLTARPNAIEDEDGINYDTATFQWFREDQEISGANSQTYVVTAADQGSRISVEYAYVDFGGTYEIEYSKPKPTVPFVDGSAPQTPNTPVVPDASEEPDESETPDVPDTPETPDIPDTPTGHINSGPVGNVFILGFPLENTDLLARLDALFDRDNILENTGRFQWLRDGDPIEGATDNVYTVTAEDRGAVISVQYTYTDGYGTVETVVSDPETPVPFPEGLEPEDRDGSDGTPDPAMDGQAGETGVTTPEDDVVIITPAMSRLDGLDGTDTAVLAGDQTDYTVTFGPDGVTVADRNADGLGTVELTDFEFLDFGTELPMFDGPMDLTQFGGHTGLEEAEFSAFVEMYIAYFNRAPDAIGLAFWGTAFANGMSMEEIASEFADQPETLAAYPADLSNIRFTADVYENVLGRSPDIDGLRFWTEALDSGAVDRGEFILQVLQGVKAAPPADATQEFIDRQAADQAYLEAKSDLGALFAVHRGMSNVDDASMIMGMFDGSAESLASAVEAVDTLYTAAQDPVNGDFLMPLVGVLDDPFAI